MRLVFLWLALAACAHVPEQAPVVACNNAAGAEKCPTGTHATYPFLGFTALGPPYTAVALTCQCR